MSVKVAFVGTGGIAGAHLNALTKVREAKIVALCDVDKKRVRARAKEYNATAYTDYRKMFDTEDLDACFICVPPFVHPHIELYALKKKINLLIEKPVALSIKDTKRVERAIRKSNCIVASGYVLRYQPNIDRIKKLFKGKKVVMAYGRYFSCVPGAPWWGLKSKSGGQLVEQATHVVDMARYLAGDIKSVNAVGVKGIIKRRNHDIEDAMAMTFKFANGAIGAMATTCAQWGFAPDLEILTKDLRIHYYIMRSLEVITPKGTKKYKEKGSAMVAQDRTFIQAVKTGNRSKVRCLYPDAAKTLAVTLAANESVKTGKTVHIK